jgi:hypothetical protein
MAMAFLMAIMRKVTPALKAALVLGGVRGLG